MRGQTAHHGREATGRIVFLFQEQGVVGLKFDILDYNRVMALKLGVFRKNGFVHITDLTIVRFDVVLFAVLLSFFGFLRSFSEEYWLEVLNLWLSLFALETVDLIL